MYYFLSLLAGILISIMVVFNGGLTEHVGQFTALMVIHVVGLLFIVAFMAIRREKPRLRRLPPWLYAGGFIGIITTVFNNTAFGNISVSAMMALGLLGESVSGILADHFGLLGLPVRPFRREKLWGGAVALLGVVVMMRDLHPLPVALCLMAGVTVLFSRLINARLAGETSVRTSTLCNYITGLLGAACLFLLFGGGGSMAQVMSGPRYIYFGGMLGAVIVLMSNFIVGKIPSFYMTLALFVGQVFAGLGLDMLLEGSLPVRNAIGGALVLCGLVMNLLSDQAKRAATKTA